MMVADLAGYSSQFSPRKQRTFEYTGQFFQGGGIWNKNRYYTPQPDSPEMKWIGKYFIPWGSQPANPNASNYVLEHEMAEWAKPYIYQVLWTDGEGNLKSLPEAELRPGRMNVFVNAVTNIISDVQYF
jgi:hypothetical protein